MVFYSGSPTSNDDIDVALTTYIKESLAHLKAAINQEHGWSDSSASASTHDATLFKSKIGTLSRGMASSSGVESISGIGFSPQVILFLGIVSTPTSKYSMSFGAYDGNNNSCVLTYDDGGSNRYTTSSAYAVSLLETASKYQYGSVTDVGNDGFDITWVRSSSSPGSATASIFYLCLRFS